MASSVLTSAPSSDTFPPPHIAQHVESTLGRIINVQEIQSAQQEVWFLTFETTTSSNTATRVVVLRIWKNCATWWNLHCNSNQGLLKMARLELSAYRIAKQALSSTEVCIPSVLYFSHQTLNANTCPSSHPWALMEYVGPTSALFDSSKMCTKWMDSMVKVRHEFGFDEPHPRWGRVPADTCLEYAMQVLNQVIIPMHLFINENEVDFRNLGVENSVGAVQPRRYHNMIHMYKESWKKLDKEVQQSSLSMNDMWLKEAIQVLNTCIDALEKEARKYHLNEGDETCVPAVLLHMDCQPQNLIFRADDNNPSPRVISVLDWEEAAYADARFELLLLCRKVCCNRTQAHAIWNHYEKEMEIDLGPLEPWLKLEAIHSITTLLLQGMNLLEGGRNPWETKPDLQGKVEREFQRLHHLGWTFCQQQGME